MNYYKQGDAANADKIKAAFERLGYDTSFVQKLSASDVHILFTLPCDTRVHAFHTAYIEADILKRLVNIDPGYTELELPIEHEFKVGDWVVKKDGKTFYGGNYAVQITSIEVDEGSRHIWLSSTTWVRDNDIRLWSIADAKDGDVLATDNGWTCIFKPFDGCAFSSYCFMDSQNWFCESGAEGHTLDSRINGNIHPATKEQRDLLFAKMKEDGYEWDSDKKELRKIVEANFKVGDWLFHKTLGVHPILVKDYSERQGYKVEGLGLTYCLQKCTVENEYHLWTIEDAKDGDVLVSGIDNPFIYDGNIEFSSAGAYVGVSRNGRIRLDMFPSKAWTSVKGVKPATKEQRDLLFKKMREAGYEWDADKKELRKVQSHYDITNLHAGMPVLVRNSNESVWVYLQYSHRESKYSRCFNAGGQYWYQCIPFNVHTEHLLGTTDMCAEEFINWVI
jgi:hypothetical protein